MRIHKKEKDYTKGGQWVNALRMDLGLSEFL